MDTILAHLVRHRGFAASVLAVGSAGVMVLTTITAQTAINPPHDKVILSMRNAPYVVREDGTSLPRDAQNGFDVTVTADGQTTMLRVLSGTVGEALDTVGVTVGEDDILSAAIDDALVPDMDITVQRVTYREYTDTVAIPFETETRNDKSLKKGTTKVETEGQDGEQVITYQERLVDGEVVESNRIAAETLREPVTKKVVKGTYTEPVKAAANAVTTGSYTEDDVYCLAVVIYREAGSDYLTDEHRALVGCVVMNRVRSKAFPNSIRGVLTQYGQYQGLWQNGVYFPSGVSESSHAVKRAYRIAREVLEGQWSCPANVVFQANFPQGSGTYRVMEGGGTVTYFCYR